MFCLLFYIIKIPQTMKTILKSLLCSVALLCGMSLFAQELKPRVVICTDIAPSRVEPDDMESVIRLLCYADMLEIEAIVGNPGWSCDPYPAEWIEHLYIAVEAYGKDVANLRKRSAQDSFKPLSEENVSQTIGYWPSYDYIRSRSVLGSPRAGIAALGKDNISEGSNLLIRLADEDDPRPIWVCAWGGANTLSQAIWQVSQERTPEEVKKFVQKFRLYAINDQDMSFRMRENREYSSQMWLRREFKDDLLYIWDDSASLSMWALGKADWESYASKIQGHAALGSVYPKFKNGLEGDTPSFFHVLPLGLNDPEDPTQIGWGGLHVYGLTADGKTTAWVNEKDPIRSLSGSYEKKFYTDWFNDFAARIEWAENGTGNHNPVVVIGKESGVTPITMKAKTGKSFSVDASKSYDPDGDSITYNWWFQDNLTEGAVPTMENALSSKAIFTISKGLKGKTLHLVCEIHDDNETSLVGYKRIIIEVK